MKTLFFFCTVLLMISFISCKKEEMTIVDAKPEEKPVSFVYYKDSCSYTIAGKRYTCDYGNSFGRRNAGANRDSSTGLWSTDTLQYSTNFGLSKNEDTDRSDDGLLTVHFIKKYSKAQLVNLSSNMIFLVPKNELELYAPGKYSFALDFERFDRQNGIALQLAYRTANSLEWLSSYIRAWYKSPTSISPNSQDNSSFEITRFEKLPNGPYLLEAKFEVNAFDKNETAFRVEKGYLRLNVF